LKHKRMSIYFYLLTCQKGRPDKKGIETAISTSYSYFIHFVRKVDPIRRGLKLVQALREAFPKEFVRKVDPIRRGLKQRFWKVEGVSSATSER